MTEAKQLSPEYGHKVFFPTNDSYYSISLNMINEVQTLDNDARLKNFAILCHLLKKAIRTQLPVLTQDK